MTALLGIAAVLLVGSSLLKLRAAERAKLGLHFPSVLELLAGLGIGASMLGGGPNVDIAFRLALGALDPLMWEVYQATLKDHRCTPAWASWYEENGHVFSTALVLDGRGAMETARVPDWVT